ncbi:excinuclease ABC subunit B [Candidatus Gottesmanbacteria bacterium RIFCSPLOWO2_01_FULL_43_11b]|uniref:UvrABC system protein B n=1 Tax=Candidatus Gottesmanbacteria bacterium RIFCSPLOWO2_01_FULL_43_11b TaxID=1798392 RepID=A0A1F6AG14_9BACT|nr:MAG: excinuclease ABC subunit B [Candidatus Gottesmanbacteria bacterium RIFCSPLOWO2_01_FULL_43_11b]
MGKFKLQSTFQPTGDQPQAIEALVKGLKLKLPEQVLIGVTGSGKTFTMANVIANVQRPTLIISHNKTLAAQLYQEFRDFFPNNAVSYFVSYYDYYQPEAYIPQTDTYIEKETEINEEIDKLRLAATTNLLTRKDTIIVASVSCIYNIGSPKEYGHFVLELRPGTKVTRESIFDRLVDLQYSRSDYGFHRGTFRVRGDTIDLFPAYEDSAIRIVMGSSGVISLDRRDPLTGKKIEDLPATVIYPAKHYMTDPRMYKDVFAQIRQDMEERVKYFTKNKKFIEAQRIRERVTYDLEMIQEVGFVNGIENYSRYFDGRKPGEPPYTLLDYFEEAAGRDYLLFIDESHMTVPQIRGMYHGDRSRKQTLIDYGFRLPAAIDNRPLRIEEFLRRMPQTVYVSATPSEWEVSRAETVEQLIRPTGLVDPAIDVRPSSGQIEDLISEIQKRVVKKERVLVTTLTKRTAEDLSKFLKDRGINVHYLHSDIITLERSDILADLRGGVYDVIVGINLLREGLDLPEVSLVAVLDADKEGFLRSRVSLIQTMGRAARHVAGQVILYADTMTGSMREAIEEVTRRRNIQLEYNKKHGVTPKSISKPIRSRLVEKVEEIKEEMKVESMTPMDKKKAIVRYTKLLRESSRDLDFESAARFRDLLTQLQGDSS